jgi:1,2-diacylglycerol 3-alpha-glucosyltransferase
MAMPDPNSPPAPLKVWAICSGVGIMNRGIESFFRECFDGLHPASRAAGIQLELIKGKGPPATDEHRVWCLPRTGMLANVLGKVIHRSGYVVEQLSSLPGIVRRIRRGRPHVILYSDSNMAMRLHRFRHRIGVPYRLIYSNGAPLKPPFRGCDHVHQVAPFYLQQALDAGEDPKRHSLVPYGFTVPTGTADFDPNFRRAARRELNLPPERKIVLSVGNIDRHHKRMDYLVDEVASLPAPRPFLLMLGAMDESSESIIAEARQKLGEENCIARSVPYEQVFRHYQAADCFALCSLAEGFGRVYVEACMHGLPCAAHDHPVMRYVLGEEGTFGDFRNGGGLAQLLKSLLSRPLDQDGMTRRRETMRNRFSWQSLAPAYFEMFRAAAAMPTGDPAAVHP